MMLDPEFAAHLAHLDEVSLSTSSDVICVIDDRFVLRGYNAAWRQFAACNGGPQLLRSYGIGRSILPAIPEPLQRFYTEHYRAALSSGKPFEHDYQCSSPERYRHFRQTAYPLPDRSGLLISHHLVAESAEVANASAATTAISYRDASGTIVQCMHCRKLRRPSDPAHWDWVPALVEKPATETSHALCPRCLDFYYPDLPDLPDSAAAKP